MKKVLKNLNGEELKIEYKEKPCNKEEKDWFVGETSFSGHHVLWSFEYSPYNYLKSSEISGDDWRKGGDMIIHRNGLSVFKEFCRNPERAFVVLQHKLPQLQDFMGWDELTEGRKIYYHDIPSTIKHILKDGEIYVVPAEGLEYPVPAFEIEDGEEEYSEYRDGCKTHILDNNIWWFRKV